MIRRAFVALVCLSLLSVAKGQEQPLRIIDVHTHTSLSGEVEKGRNIKQTEAQLAKTLLIHGRG